MKNQKYISKNKNILYLICIFNILSLIFNIGTAHAITPTAIPTPIKTTSPAVSQALNEKLNSQINQLKDKIASRVSELNLVEKRGIIGIVTEISANKITLTDVSGNPKQIDVDEITKFISVPAKTSFGLSDLSKGSRISVFGLYNKQSKRILARFIRISVDPVFATGGISELDNKNFTLTVTSGNQKKTKIDVGTATKISSYGKDGVITKIGFAKLAIGDRVLIVGFPDKKDTSLIISSRINVFSSLPKDPKINIAQPIPTSSATPTILPTSAIIKKPSPTLSQ